MLNNILSSRTIIAGLAFFVLMVAGSLLYNWHVQHSSQKDLDRTKQIAQQLQNRPSVETVQSTEQRDIVLSVEKQNTAEDIHPGQAQTKTITDNLQEKSAEAEIIAEEEAAEEVLSAKERRHRELDKRLKEVHKEIEAIVAAAGGKITQETHPVEIQQVARLQKELFQLMLEGTGDPMLRDFIAVMDAGQRFQSHLSANGEIPVSEAFKIADFIETELGNERGAAGIRTLAQYAIDNGSDVITQEHFDAEFKAPE